MTHLPYIVASYAIAVGVTVAYSVAAWLRLRLAKHRLAAVDPRARPGPRPGL